MKNQKVDQYIQKQPLSRQKILKRLRQIILKTFPQTKEEFLWGVPVYQGGKFYLASLKKQVNLGLSIIGLNPDEIKLFEGTGKTMRHLKISSLDSINEKYIVKLLKLVNQKTSCPNH